ncbi:hypothetical protein LT493_29065 [Streptomyces tricolor]|nr:hypothetical protein [Streptomyces tricolor]
MPATTPRNASSAGCGTTSRSAWCGTEKVSVPEVSRPRDPPERCPERSGRRTPGYSAAYRPAKVLRCASPAAVSRQTATSSTYRRSTRWGGSSSASAESSFATAHRPPSARDACASTLNRSTSSCQKVDGWALRWNCSIRGTMRFSSRA